jgi:hypothetical protein
MIAAQEPENGYPQKMADHRSASEHRVPTRRPLIRIKDNADIGRSTANAVFNAATLPNSLHPLMKRLGTGCMQLPEQCGKAGWHESEPSNLVTAGLFNLPRCQCPVDN